MCSAAAVEAPQALVVVRPVGDDAAELDTVAALRAAAYYDDLEERQALPFHSRFRGTFEREFCEREVRSLQHRTRVGAGGQAGKGPGSILRCSCLVGLDARGRVLGCLDVSFRRGPCLSLINGLCVLEGDSYVYVDNVCVAEHARRQGVASQLMEAASAEAAGWGVADRLFTHVHVENDGARVLYARYGFELASRPESAASQGLADSFERARDTMSGLLLLSAPLPLELCGPPPAGAAEPGPPPPGALCTCGAALVPDAECVCAWRTA